MESTETTTVKFCIEPKISQNVRVYQRLFLPSWNPHFGIYSMMLYILEYGFYDGENINCAVEE